MVTYPGVLQADTTRKASDTVWNYARWLEVETGQKSGIQVYDDFGSFDATANVYKIVGTNGTATLLATDDGGVVRLSAPAAAANNESYLVYSIGQGVIAQFLQNTNNELWFECRVRPQNIVDGGYFIGFTTPAAVASGFLANATSAPNNANSYVGFNSLQASPSRLDISYNVAAGAGSSYVTGAATLVAGTFLKLGWHFFSQNGANKVRFYVNGTEVPDTNGVLGRAVTVANFPNSTLGTFVFAAKTNTANAVNLDIDWWRMLEIIDNQ